MRTDDATDLRRRMAQHEQLGGLCRDIAVSRDADDAARVVARAVLSIFPEVGRASIGLVDDDGEHFHVHSLAGDGSIFAVGTRLPLASTTIGRSVADRVQIVVRRADTDDAASTLEVRGMWKAGFHTVVITPLVVGERAFGSLQIASADPAAFPAADATLLAQIAAIVAANLDRHHLLAALRTALAASRAREQELQVARAEQEAVIRSQQETLEETAAPTIPIADRIIVLPVIGALDEARARHFIDVAVRGSHEHRAEVVLIDLTGLRRVDAVAGQCFVAVTGALRLLGARVILTGMPPALAEALVGLGLDLRGLTTRATLEHAVAEALARRRR
jgi:anti-anti-sigma regulatory factor